MILQLCDDNVPVVAKDMDAFLLDTSALVQAVVEACQTESGPPQPEANLAAESEANSAAGSASDPAEKFHEDLEKDLLQYSNFIEERAAAMAQIHAAEETYAKQIEPAASDVARQHADKYAPMFPFKADYRGFTASLQKLLEDRMQEIAAHCGCDVGDILRVVILSL